MKLLYLNVGLVVLIFSSLTGATQVVNDNEDLRETIKSLRKTVESLQVTFGATQSSLESSLARCSKVKYWSIGIQVTDRYNANFLPHIWLLNI